MPFLIWVYNVIVWFCLLASIGFAIRAVGFHIAYAHSRHNYRQKVGPKTFDIMRKYWNLRFWNTQAAGVMFAVGIMFAAFDTQGYLFPNFIWLAK